MTSKDRIENAIRHIQTATDIDPWAMEIAVNAMLRMLNVDGDLISRRDGIDHFRLIVDATNKDSEYNMGFVDGLEFCISHLSTMPSAQPDFDITVKIEKAYDDGYEAGYLQGRHDWSDLDE